MFLFGEYQFGSALDCEPQQHDFKECKLFLLFLWTAKVLPSKDSFVGVFEFVKILGIGWNAVRRLKIQ